MTRAAGDANHYRFALVDAKGEVVDLPQYTLNLPSVSHIMEVALAGKAGPLKGWAYNMALEGALSVAEEWNPDEWASLDALKAAMKSRGLTPWANLKQASERGQGVHGFFEALMEGRIEFAVKFTDGVDEEHDHYEVVTDPITNPDFPALHWRVARPEEHPTVPLPKEVEEKWQPLDGYMRGVMHWFLRNEFYGRLKSLRDQTVTERPVWSLNAVQPYCGTLDLMMPRTIGPAGEIPTKTVGWAPRLTLTDLKTSGNKLAAERKIYDENRVQLTAYSRAARECIGLEPVTHSILVVDSTGDYREHFIETQPRKWDAVLNLYAAMKGA